MQKHVLVKYQSLKKLRLQFNFKYVKNELIVNSHHYCQLRWISKIYKQVTGLPVIKYTPDFAELKTPTATITIGSTNTLQVFGGDEVAEPAQIAVLL